MAMTSLILRIVLFVAFAAPAAANTSGGLGKWALGKWGGGKNADKPDACSCKDDTNGPVCHPGKMDFVADCAAQAECQGVEANYVSCAALRSVSWRHECSCRHSWDPVCDWKGHFVAPNWECSKCLKLKASSRCKESNVVAPKIKQRDCQCPKEFQDTQEPICSTVTGLWISADACTAYCRGFKSFMPCSQMPNRKALVPATGLEDKPIKQQTCSMVGAKVGDAAGKLGCLKVLQTCSAAGRKRSPDLDGWESGLTVLPSCFSGESENCYEAATDWALEDEECLAVLSQDTKRCSAATARRLFGGAVSRVCGEEVRDGESFGFWSSN